MPKRSRDTRKHASSDEYDARPAVKAMFARAIAAESSDIHLEPYSDRYALRLRIDGVLQEVESYSRAQGSAIVNALMVMAELLTYRQDVPQEGRIQIEDAEVSMNMRLAVTPTTRGLKAVLRLPSGLGRSQRLDELGLPADVLAQLRRYIRATSGMLLVVGPAGSGKTTTLYALLRELISKQPGLSVVSLEDPVEHELEGVTQIEVSAFGELTYERALRSMVRQDPEVLMLGEIRDAATATLAVQAALSGHRLMSTMHAGTAGEALSRLLEMQLEPYQITGAVAGVLSMRLVRKISKDADEFDGRVPVAAFAEISPAIREQLLQRADAKTLDQTIAAQAGSPDLIAAGERLLSEGVTNEEELSRVLGLLWDERETRP